MILFHFDVLALPSETLATRQPSFEGRRLWNTFWDRYQGRLVLTGAHDLNEDILSDWLKKEGYKPSIIQLAKPPVVDGACPRADVVWEIQGVMGRLEWYIDNDPDAVARALRMGIPSLLVAVPSFSRPEWHQEDKIRAWDDVVTELEQQALKKSERTWKDQ